MKKVFIACNNIASWAEVEGLSKLESLEEVALAGNNNLPNYSQMAVFEKLPKLLRVDGWSADMVANKDAKKE